MTIKEFRAYCNDCHPDKGLLLNQKQLCSVLGISKERFRTKNYACAFPFEIVCRQKMYNREDIFRIIQSTRSGQNARY